MKDTILRDVDLAELVSESFSRAADDLPPLAFIPIVELALSAVHERKSVGLVEIPNWLLKTCVPIISNPVCSIYNSSIREGYVPKLWKSADVLPLGKIPNLSVLTPT